MIRVVSCGLCTVGAVMRALRYGGVCFSSFCSERTCI